MRLEDLVGTWSVDAQYGPGAQSDEQLHFSEDGSAAWNTQAGRATAAVFRWSLLGDRLTTLGTYSTPLGASEPYDVDPGAWSGLDPDGMQIAVADEDTSGSRLRVSASSAFPSLRLARPNHLCCRAMDLHRAL